MHDSTGKVALVTGITGQDGAYLSEFLLNRGYTVYGTFRRTSSPNFWRIASLGMREHPKLHLVEHDLTDAGASIRLLERTHAAEVPQDENTPFYPRSPYGVAKLFAHWTTINYRESYGIFGVSGILFNHESPLRGLEFVTRKITDGIARIKLGKRELLELGNLDARRDWGFAREYVDGMWRMLQAPEPGVYVLASGRNASVRDFVSLAAKATDIEIEWQGTGKHERGIDTKSGKTIVRVNPKFYRPAEVETLIGCAAKAQRDLSWEAKTSLEELCRIMVDEDLKRVADTHALF